MGVLFGKRRTFGNLEARLRETGGLLTLSQWSASQFDPSITWKEIAWLRQRWPGKLVVKGILDAEDARLAAEHGVAPSWCPTTEGASSTARRQSISVLPEVVEAVAGRCEVLFDGGVQTGQDVLKALALGARACLIGKTFLYALAAGGEAGVLKALEILRKELEVSMALSGCTDVRGVDRRVLRSPK